MPLWLTKIIATRIIKFIKYRIDLKRIDKYVNKPNELDKQMNSVQKSVNKYGKYIEEIEKDLAQVKAESHPPVFTKRNHKDILKRLKKLERK